MTLPPKVAEIPVMDVAAAVVTSGSEIAVAADIVISSIKNVTLLLLKPVNLISSILSKAMFAVKVTVE